MFGSNTTEHQLSSSALVPLGGQLPYYQEMRTVKVLDFLMTLFKNREPDQQKLRRKVNQFLYSRTRPGFYIEIIKSDLHLAYADQRDGHGSQHWWRLFFTEKWKAKIENILKSAALTVSETASTSTDSAKEEVLNVKANTLIEWGGMYFRSKTEVRIAEELYKRNVLFFGNVRGQIGRQGSPASDASGQLTGRIEVDFLVFHKSKCIILEVDGQHHQEGAQTFRDYVRDRVFLREGIPTARFTADECFNRPADVVAEFLNMF